MTGKENKSVVLKSNIDKSIKSISLLEASIRKVAPFDPVKEYTSDELEPYDALSDRFIRTVEVLFKFMRSYQLFNEAATSDTLRDLLLYIEKLNFITSVELWLEMREVRNRIVHDYLPDQQQHLFEDITGPFYNEIKHIRSKIEETSMII
jgi:uncharacterized protein with HEPN domain